MIVHEMEFERPAGAGVAESDPAEADADCCGQPLNCYALVAYLPRPLGPFLDKLRRDLEHCRIEPRAHVTLLPPRPLAADLGEEGARCELDRHMVQITPVEIEAGGIEIFEKTYVVYASISRGFEDLIEMHQRLNKGRLHYDEPFTYHPHITLAQGLDASAAAAVREEAAARWSRYRGSRRFRIDSLTFVRNLDCGRWVDLAAYSLATPVLR